MPRAPEDPVRTSEMLEGTDPRHLVNRLNHWPGNTECEESSCFCRAFVQALQLPTSQGFAKR